MAQRGGDMSNWMELEHNENVTYLSCMLVINNGVLSNQVQLMTNSPPGFSSHKVLRRGLQVHHSDGALGSCSLPKATQVAGHTTPPATQVSDDLGQPSPRRSSGHANSCSSLPSYTSLSSY